MTNARKGEKLIQNIGPASTKLFIEHIFLKSKVGQKDYFRIFPVMRINCCLLSGFKIDSSSSHVLEYVRGPKISELYRCRVRVLCNNLVMRLFISSLPINPCYKSRRGAQPRRVDMVYDLLLFSEIEH